MKTIPVTKRMNAAELKRLEEEKMKKMSFRLSVIFATSTVLYFIIKLIFL